jgi:UDP-2-acetamido-2-deoxy-ribo-hexuluronate aminotransferase
MNQIQMVDLKSQYEKIKTEVDNATQAVIASSAFINGPDVKAFQSELESYLGVKHVIPCANGTDALQIALMALGLEPGDEVITSDFTFASTVEVVGLLNLKHVLVDVDPDTFCISIESIKAAITPKTKAIIPVHLFGQCANLDEILSIAKEHDLFVIEDNAQGIGADYTLASGETKKAGTIGEIGTTSFFPSKNLGCYGDGGALFTNDDELALIIRSIVNHGMSKRYHYDRIGVNSRLDTIQAAVLRIKLRKLDGYIASRQAVAQYYNEAFSAIDRIETPGLNPSSTHVFHQYTLKIKNIDQFHMQEYLKGKGVPAMIYYPKALHTQEAYGAAELNDEDFPVTNELCQVVLSLPMHTELETEQLQFICNNVIEYLAKN